MPPSQKKGKSASVVSNTTASFTDPTPAKAPDKTSTSANSLSPSSVILIDGKRRTSVENGKFKLTKPPMLSLKTPPSDTKIKKESKETSSAPNYFSMVEAKGIKVLAPKGSKKSSTTEVNYYLKAFLVSLVDPMTGRMPEGISEGTSVLIGASCSKSSYEPCPDRAKARGEFNGSSNWLEKELADAAFIKDHFLSQFQLAKVKKTMLHNEPVKNAKGWEVRMMEGRLATEGMSEIEQKEVYGCFMEAIAKTINESFKTFKGSKSTVHFDLDRDLCSGCSFQQYLGDQEAMARLEGFGDLDEDFYDQNRAYVSACFSQGNLPRDVAARIGAPVSEVNPFERAEIIQEQLAQDEIKQDHLAQDAADDIQE